MAATLDRGIGKGAALEGPEEEGRQEGTGEIQTLCYHKRVSIPVFSGGSWLVSVWSWGYQEVKLLLKEGQDIPCPPAYLSLPPVYHR